MARQPKGIKQNDCTISSIKDVPGELKRLKRYQGLKRKQIKFNGEWMTPQAAIELMHSVYPWLT